MVAMVTVGVQPGKSSDNLEGLGSPWPRFVLSSRHSRETLTEYFHHKTNSLDRSSKQFTALQSFIVTFGGSCDHSYSMGQADQSNR